jgi:hypothetical protein
VPLRGSVQNVQTEIMGTDTRHVAGRYLRSIRDLETWTTSLIPLSFDTLWVEPDRIQRNFEPAQWQVERWREAQITDFEAKLIFYSLLVAGKLDAPKSLLSEVHGLYFKGEYPDFAPRVQMGTGFQASHQHRFRAWDRPENNRAASSIS